MSLKPVNIVTESHGDITVAYVKHGRILDSQNVSELGDELFEISDSGYKLKLVVNFEEVEYLSSAVLGKLVALQKKMSEEKATLVLCCLRPDILEVFKVTKLDKVFTIKRSEQAAIKHIKSKPFWKRG